MYISFEINLHIFSYQRFHFDNKMNNYYCNSAYIMCLIITNCEIYLLNTVYLIYIIYLMTVSVLS